MLNLITSSSPKNPNSPSERSLHAVCRAAINSGMKVYSIGVEADLERIPEMSGAALFSGYIPTDYQAIVNKIEINGGEMINSDQDSELLMKFSLWYPLIEDLTAKSMIVNSEEDVSKAIKLNLPLFIKGEVKSNKEAGFEACLAKDEQGLLDALDEARKMPITWQGSVIARELLPLKQQSEYRNGFPLSREYRVFMYHQEILGQGFYWQSKDPFAELSKTEQEDINLLCQEAQSRVETPLTLVDVGQLEDGSWKIIEIGDPQFCLFTHISALSFFEQLKQRLQTLSSIDNLAETV